ncbi:MFS transporter [Lautropia dentalis]|nr:MFS transporter [Lautropia dentalis]
MNQGEMDYQPAVAAQSRTGLGILLLLSRAMPWLVFFAVGTLGASLPEKFGPTPPRLGWLATSFFLPAALLSGWTSGCVQRKGPRQVLVLTFLITAASLMLTAAIPTLGAACVGMALGGVALAFAQPASRLAAVAHSDADSRPWMMLMVQAGMPLAAILAGAVLPPQAGHRSWAASLSTWVPMLLALALLVRVWIPADDPRDRIDDGRLDMHSHHRPPWVLAIIDAMAGLAFSCCVVWLGLYAHQLGMPRNGMTPMMISMGGAGMGALCLVTWLNQVRSADTALTTRPALAPALMLACAAVAIGLLPFASAEHRLTLWIGAAGIGAGLFGLHETLIQMLAPEYPPDPDAAILPAALRHAARSQHGHTGGRHSHTRPPFRPAAGPLMGDTVLDTTSYSGSAGTDTPASSGNTAEPATAGTAPASDAASGAGGADPEATGATPESHVAGLDTHAADPGSGAAESATHTAANTAAGWDTRGAEPASDAAGPDTSAAKHGSSEADPATTGTNPEISSAGPEISSAGPEIGRADHASGGENLQAPEAASGEPASSILSTTGATEPASLATAAQGVTDEAPTTEATAAEATRTGAVQAAHALADSLQPASPQAETPLAESTLTGTESALAKTGNAWTETPRAEAAPIEASRTGEAHGVGIHTTPAVPDPEPVAAAPKAASSWGPDTVTPLFDALGHARLPDTGVDDIQFPETISVPPDDEQTDEPTTIEPESGTVEEAPFGQMPAMEERGEELVNFQPRTPGESPLDDGSDIGRATVKILEEGNPDGELVVANPAIAQLITAHFLGAAAGPLALGATATGEFGLHLVWYVLALLMLITALLCLTQRRIPAS